MNTQPKTREERIEFYSSKIIEIRAQKEDLEEAEKRYRAALSDIVDLGDNYVGDFKVNLRENRRFDAALAKKNLSAEDLSSISVLKPDSTLAKKFLSEEDLAKCQKNFGKVVTIGLRED